MMTVQSTFSSVNNLLHETYNKLNVGAYKADFFRALYVYINGGIYFDCKQILYSLDIR